MAIVLLGMSNAAWISIWFCPMAHTEYNKIKKCCEFAKKIKLEVHAGHGLDYKTTSILSRLKEIVEFNIGHFIIGESIFYGLSKVIKNFKRMLR